MVYPVGYVILLKPKHGGLLYEGLYVHLSYV